MSKHPLPRRNSDLLNIPKDIESIHQNEPPTSPRTSITSNSSGNNTETGKSVDANVLEAAAAKPPTAPAIETLDNTATSPRSSISSSNDGAGNRSLSTSPDKSPGHTWNLKDQCFNYEQYKQQIYNKVLFGRDRVKKSWHDYRFGASGDDGGKPAESETNGTGNQHHHLHEHHRHSRQNSIEDPAITASAPATSASVPPPTTSTSTHT
ncbi:hypothetical protein D0Z00_003748 [Geotrichum galactomycetum]|uniref:Uncharacterized protein n=1 Tax=Geotrichum galactomycetum TaxID=27317 RepID=A0ACB6V0H1_9ASCO|nr:hypothetical protein D0Z00_003748 [Geotrichum candidum]